MADPPLGLGARGLRLALGGIVVSPGYILLDQDNRPLARPHPPEGFGLMPAEAMSLGKPAMMTRWSGNTDYMTADNSIGVDYRLVELDRAYGPYRAGLRWAEPDLAHAAAWMARLVREPGLAAAVGARGRATVERLLSASAGGERIRRRLAAIRAGEV